MISEKIRKSPRIVFGKIFKVIPKKVVASVNVDVFKNEAISGEILWKNAGRLSGRIGRGIFRKFLERSQ